jgi:hypothetical protein
MRMHVSWLSMTMTLIAASATIVGGMLVLLLAGSGVIAALRLGRGSGIDRMLGPILLGAIVGGMVESFVETGVLNAGGLFAFPFWMAVALAHSLRIAQMRGTFGADPGATGSITHGPRTRRYLPGALPPLAN